MKNLLKSLLLVSAVSATLVGCATTHDKSDSAGDSSKVSSKDTANSGSANSGSANSGSVVSSDNYNSVFFGFNQYNIVASYDDLVKANAEYLLATPAAKVKLEGNTDTVGSVEFNVALGQKRAVAVKNSLVALGANAKSIEAVSNGLSQPLDGGKEVEKNPLNRRVDVIYTSEAPAGYSFDKAPHVSTGFFSGTVEAGIE